MQKIKFIEKIKKNNIHLCIAESITGGRFTSEIVKVRGASSFLDYSIVSYSNNSKSTFFEIESYIKRYGVVSSEVASKMAVKVIKYSSMKNKLGIACTGLASNSSVIKNHKTGTVFIGIYYNKKSKVVKKEFKKKTRSQVISLTVNEMFKQALLVI